MNKLYAFYCRAYQAVFRAALPILPYREPIQLDGLSSIVPLLAEKRIASVLLVTDASVRSLGLTSGMEAALKAAGVACAVYDKTVPNPTIANIEEGRALYLTAHAQAIIAVGGGSVMDCAKVIGARVVKPRQSVQRMRGLLRVLKRTPLLIAVPTTAGTGSETTLAAVITDPAARHKYPINDFALIPDYAVLDPELTRGLPPMLTATTGMDALTHAIEAYIGRSTNRLTRAMSEEAATRIVRSLYKAYTDGGDMQARADMLRAAYCAGVSFTRSYVGYVHGVAHSLGGQCGVPHGLANAVILPYFLDAYGAACHKKLGRLARIAGVASPNASDSEAAEAFIRWIRETNAKMGIPETIPQIRTVDIPEMAHHAAKESNPLYPVPVLMDEGRLAQMYLKLMPAKEENA